MFCALLRTRAGDAGRPRSYSTCTKGLAMADPNSFSVSLNDFLLALERVFASWQQRPGAAADPHRVEPSQSQTPASSEARGVIRD